MLVYLRKRETFADLAAGSGVGTACAMSPKPWLCWRPAPEAAPGTDGRRQAGHTPTSCRAQPDRCLIGGVIRELASTGRVVLADKGLYTGAGEHVHTPYRGRNKLAPQRAVTRAHAELRSPGARGQRQLKTWHILRKLRG